MVDSFTLAGTNPAILPRNIASSIWDKVKVQSIVPAMSTEVPIIFGDNSFPVVTGRPAAGIVGEGEARPGDSMKLDAKVVRPVTAAVIIELSKQAIRANPSNMLTTMETLLSGAISRQVDLAVIHGRAANTGALLTGGNSFLSQTTQRIELGDSNHFDQQLWDGYEIIADSEVSEFSGFAFDPIFYAKLANARDTLGRKLNPELPMKVEGVSTYGGYNAAVSRGVSGRVDRSADTSVRAIGGDWDSLKFGFQEDIQLTPIPYGDPLGNGDLVRRGMTAFMAEVTFGWAVMDLNSFVLYENPAAGVPSTPLV